MIKVIYGYANAEVKSVLKKITLGIALAALGLNFPGTLVTTTPPEAFYEVSQLRLELEADRILFAPNLYIQDSLFVEGEILQVGDGWIEIEQHLNSPPYPVGARINVHPHTLVQLRTVDSKFNLLAVTNSFSGTETLKKGDVASILFLPETKLAKSIIIFRSTN
jgi:hypothetical protein